MVSVINKIGLCLNLLFNLFKIGVVMNCIVVNVKVKYFLIVVVLFNGVLDSFIMRLGIIGRMRFIVKVLKKMIRYIKISVWMCFCLDMCFFNI